ncbi:MAG: hypothetical protein ACLRQ0_14315 [Monoglobales bacterium]
MSKEIKYNLPGYGFTKCYVFDYAIKLIDILTQKDLIEKMKNTYQLGTMRYVYPGAHHTRYEYVFTQLLLISNLATYKGNTERNIDISIGSNLNEYKNIGNISGADVMQCLAILSNAGHMYDTFTSSKILLKLLKMSKKENTKYYKVYKNNLPKEVINSFNTMLDTSNYYKLHLFNMLHLITGMTRQNKYKDVCNLAIKLLIGLLESSTIKNEATRRVFYLYKKIRKIAYLSVDMIYTPASVGMNLNRMIYSFPSYTDELFNEDSTMNKAILQLEDMIHKQIYDSPRCILNSTRIEQESFNKYRELTSKINDIRGIRRLIYEQENNEFSLHSKKQPTAIQNIIEGTEIIFSIEAKDTDLRDLLIHDEQILKEIPTSRIVYGSQVSQNLHTIFSSFALSDSNCLCEDTQTIIKEVVKHKIYNEHGKIELVKYAIKSIYKYNEYFFSLSGIEEYDANECVFIGQGCKKISHQIKQKFNGDNVKDVDKLHEIYTCADTLEKTSYTGTVLCFVGSIKANEYKKSEVRDEIDGFIYFPSINPKQEYAIILEAKNYKKGETDAAKQLEETKSYLSNQLDAKIDKHDEYACLILSVKPS